MFFFKYLLRFYFVLGRSCPIVVPATIWQIEGSRRIYVRDKAYRRSQARSWARHEACKGENRQEQEDARGAQEFWG